jgi:hypothetical protein
MWAFRLCFDGGLGGEAEETAFLIMRQVLLSRGSRLGVSALD